MDRAADHLAVMKEQIVPSWAVCALHAGAQKNPDPVNPGRREKRHRYGP